MASGNSLHGTLCCFGSYLYPFASQLCPQLIPISILLFLALLYAFAVIVVGYCCPIMYFCIALFHYYCRLRAYYPFHFTP